MFTQCPECGCSRSLSVDELRHNHGMIRCTDCSALFDALPRLSETAVAAPTAPAAESAWTESPHQASGYWGLTVLLAVGLLIGQLVYFEGPKAIQDQNIRPLLEQTCRLLKCALPVYRHPDEFSVLQSTLTRANETTYLFRAIIANQAAFPQRPPAVKLTFMNRAGLAFAQGIFQASDYVDAPSSLIAVDNTFVISLRMAPPATAIGGYSFELI